MVGEEEGRDRQTDKQTELYMNIKNFGLSESLKI